MLQVRGTREICIDKNKTVQEIKLMAECFSEMAFVIWANRLVSSLANIEKAEDKGGERRDALSQYRDMFNVKCKCSKWQLSDDHNDRLCRKGLMSYD